MNSATLSLSIYIYVDIAVFSLVNHFEISVLSQIYHEQISKGGWNQMRTLNYRIRNWRVINLEPG
jgi:hypothetical protein